MVPERGAGLKTDGEILQTEMRSAGNLEFWGGRVLEMMVCRDGMATMTHRTTFALDEATAQRIRSLAASWKVSQAEVVRRVVSLADMPAAKLDPVAMLLKLHQEGGGACGNGR